MQFILGQHPYQPIKGMTSLHLPGAGSASLPQVGMIKRLVELNKKFDIIYGCSGGAINAAMLAQGDIDLLEHLWLNIRNKDVRHLSILKMFSGEPALYDFSPLLKTLKKYLDPDKIAKCTSQIFVAATSVKYNCVTYYELKKLPPNVSPAQVVLASCSIPILTPPAMVRSDELVDGGVTDLYSIEEAASRGVEEMTILIPKTPMQRGSINSLIDAVEVVITLPGWSNYLHQKQVLKLMSDPKPTLIEVAPGVPTGIGLFDFDMPGINRERVIQYGYDLVKEKVG